MTKTSFIPFLKNNLKFTLVERLISDSFLQKHQQERGFTRTVENDIFKCLQLKTKNYTAKIFQKSEISIAHNLKLTCHNSSHSSFKSPFKTEGFNSSRNKKG